MMVHGFVNGYGLWKSYQHLNSAVFYKKKAGPFGPACATNLRCEMVVG
jgi:hypothetical protein